MPSLPMPSPRTIALYAVALLLLVAMVLAVLGLRRDDAAPVVTARGVAQAAATPAMPPPPPAVEPLELLEVTRDDARAINANVPFVPGPIPAARPFRFAGTPADRERAITCLAAAAWYEAGDDTVGEKAVAQVVLNRVRHPAYPGTVCGVVFQGSERRTGCQFTFTCDGALVRVPSAAAWARSREVAGRALDGFVEKAVGTATHYHTDWVVPYWSSTLDKIAAVQTHLFFRWRGLWGKPAAFTGRYAGGEVMDARLAALAGPAAADTVSVEEAGMIDDMTTAAPVMVGKADLTGNSVRLTNAAGTEFALALDARAYPGSYAVLAAGLCKARPVCIVAGWTQAARVPARLPLPAPALRTATFVYRKGAAGMDQALWNCRQVARDDPGQCLPGTEPGGTE